MPQVVAAETTQAELDVPRERRPRHIAIIMDGNGRWARRRGLARIFGHREGAIRVSEIVEECSHLGIDALTLFSFSSENWKRPADEVAGLMDLCVLHLKAQTAQMVSNNVRFRRIGRRDGLPAEVLTQLDVSEEQCSRCDGMTFCLALNYGSRAEIVDAVRSLVADASTGVLSPNQITEALISERLYTHGLPDPDLLIRTAGELRLSNYLLWQVSYAEMHITDVLWPDFRTADLYRAIRDFASRKRRFGGLSDLDDAPDKPR